MFIVLSKPEFDSRPDQCDITAAMLVFQTPILLCKRSPLFQKICIDAGHVSENALYRDS